MKYWSKSCLEIIRYRYLPFLFDVEDDNTHFKSKSAISLVQVSPKKKADSCFFNQHSSSRKLDRRDANRQTDATFTTIHVDRKTNFTPSFHMILT